MSELQIHCHDKENTRVFYPQGFINAHTVQDFERSLQSALESGCYKILINCQSLSYINSSGLGVLMGVIEEIQENEGYLFLSNMNDTVFHIFDTLGFTHLFKVYGDEAEALNANKNDEDPDD